MNILNMKNKKSAARDTTGMFSAGGQGMAYHRPFMDVREFLSSIWRQKNYVIAAVMLALTVAGLYLAIVPKSYTATAQLLVDLNRPLTNEAQLIGADTTRFMMGPVLDSQVEIILSNRILGRVIERMGYYDSAHAAPVQEAGNPTKSDISPAALNQFKEKLVVLANRILGSVTEWTGYYDSAHPTPMQGAGNPTKSDISPTALNQFKDKLDVRRKGLTMILQVQFIDRDPERAALVANTIVDQYLVERESMGQAASRQAVETLKLRIEKAQQEVAKNEMQLQKISDENNLFPVGGTTLDERGVAETATQLNLARTEAAKALADLQQWESHSEDKTGTASIAKIADAHHNYDVARNQVLILEKNLADVKREYAKNSPAMKRYIQLQKEAQATNDSYMAMAARIKLLETEQNNSMFDIQTLDRAGVPAGPSSPNNRLVLAGGLLVGLGLGLTLALIKDHMSTVLRTPLLVHSNLGVPHIASLNRLHGRKTDLFTVLASQPNSPFVRGITTIHRFLAETRSDGQCIVAIVSASDGDGKSTVAAALAQYAASFTNQRTALIDCDIHERTLSKRFAPDAPYSFAQAVNGALAPARVMTVPHDCTFSLYTAPAEENTLSDIEMLMSPGMTNFIKAIGRKHDLVVLDTPGILNNVEARALISLADIVILVVDARSTTVENIAAAKDMAPCLENKLAGAVLNHVI